MTRIKRKLPRNVSDKNIGRQISNVSITFKGVNLKTIEHICYSCLKIICNFFKCRGCWQLEAISFICFKFFGHELQVKKPLIMCFRTIILRSDSDSQSNLFDLAYWLIATFLRHSHSSFVYLCLFSSVVGI